MKHIIKTFFLLILYLCTSNLYCQTQDSTTRTLLRSLQFDGVIKTKAETSLEAGAVRFNVRNSRVGLRGKAGQYLSYRVQIELSNEGTLAPLDLNGTLHPIKSLSFVFGQLHVPFENGYIITPAEMMFANRAFVGKYFTPGSRDIGAVANYRLSETKIPVEIQAGMFNGGKINNPQWTNNPSYAARLIVGALNGFRSSLKLYRYNGDQLDLLLTAADLRYCTRHLRLEAEAMHRKSETDGSKLSGGYLQGAYSFYFHSVSMFNCLTPALRFDAMGYNTLSRGFDVSRFTAGINFGLSFIPYDSVLRIDYENYFLRRATNFPDFDNRDPHVADDKLTVELVVKF